MRRLLIIAAAASFGLASPASAALPVGAKAPDFTTPGALDGKPFSFSLSKALRKGPVVVYFFPAAFTKGCTIETKAFADASDDFHRAGATIVGVAADPIETLQRFSTEACRSKFPVAVASPEMIKSYDVQLPSMPRSNRTSYVIGKDSKIAFVLSDLRPEGHITGTLETVRAMHGDKPAR